MQQHKPKLSHTHFNVLLDNGQKTMGDDAPLLSETVFWTSVKKTIERFLTLDPGQTKSQVRAIDIGCLDGAFSVELARMGFDTIGLDARQENIDTSNNIKKQLNLPNLNFVVDDARNLAKYGKFDITFCYGLLYHLNDPVNFINILSQCTTKMLLLNTHYAPEHDARYLFGDTINRYVINPIQKRIPALDTHRNYKLSKITTNEGYRGRWFFEWDEKTSKEKIESSLWASYNNSRSFWLCKKDLVTALHDAGFKHVFEQFDFTGDIVPHNYNDYLSRSSFVAIK